MAINDLAIYSAFAKPGGDNSGFFNAQTILQLDLPNDNPELRNLFSCQLSLDQRRWENTDLGKKLKLAASVEHDLVGGVISNIVLSRDKFIGRFALCRLLTLFGRVFNVESHDPADILLSIKAQTRSVQRIDNSDGSLPKRPWLVRLAILSGGLNFEDVNVLHENQDFHVSADKFIWPSEDNLRGIFFTGSELQIEVGRRDKIRRFRLLGVGRNDLGQVKQAIWEHIRGTAFFSELQDEVIRNHQGTITTDHRRFLQPESTVKTTFDSLKATCGFLKVTLGNNSVTAGAVPIVLVTDMDTATSKSSEFYKIDWTVGFGTNTGFNEEIEWRPRTLTIKNGELILSDVDEVDRILRTGQSSAELEIRPADVELRWTTVAADGIDPTLPVTRFVGSADQSSPTLSRDLWFLARSTQYSLSPASWAHMSATEAAADPAQDALRETRLSGPFRFKKGLNAKTQWLTTVAPALGENNGESIPANIQLVIPITGGRATLQFSRPNVTVDSPPLDFYSQPLNDPKSVPNERQPHLAQRNRTDSLRFVYRPDWAQERPATGQNGRPESFVLCKYDALPTDTTKKSFLVRHAPQAVELYLPAEHALVDPVSVTRGNLVGRQIVAFPLFQIGPVASTISGVYFLEIRHTRDDKGNITESEFDLEKRDTNSKPARVDFSEEEMAAFADTGFRGFFVQLETTSQEKRTFVTRIRSQTITREKLTLRVDPRAELVELATDSPYSFSVGPTRLALPRDVNHGLIPIGVQEFWFEDLEEFVDGRKRPVLGFTTNSIRGNESQSVFALHPWTEWGPNPDTWIKTGRARLHHRNLIQEHAEFESSFEDRFPPEGPAPDPETGKIPSPLLPLGDYLRAVRDRYTEASGNLLKPSNESEGVRNWLPHSRLVRLNDSEVKPEVKFELVGDLPETKLKPPTVLSDVDIFRGQSLKLRKADESGAELHWLDASVSVKSLSVGSKPQLILTQTDASDPLSRRALDSSVPLLFSRHDITALATIDFPGPENQTVVIAGGSESPASVYLLSDTGVILHTSQLQLDSDEPLLDVGLLRHGEGNSAVIRGLAGSKDKKLKRFVIKVSNEDSEFKVDITDVLDVVLPEGNKPIAIANQQADREAAFAVLARKSNGDKSIHIVKNSGLGASFPANATAVALSRNLNDELRVAYGDKHGEVHVVDSNGNSVEILSAWTMESKVLGTDLSLKGIIDPKLSAPSPAPIRSLHILHLNNRRLVVGCDGSRFASTWGFAEPTSLDSQVWLQPADALSIGLGKVFDLEGRRQQDDPTDPFDVPLFAVGLRSGEFRIAAALPNSAPTNLVEVQILDTATAPVLKVQLPFAAEGRVAPCFVGTSAGTVLSWDLRTGIEWPDTHQPANGVKQVIKRLLPSSFLDGLGVVREIPQLSATKLRIIIENLSIEDQIYNSLSTSGYRLTGELPAGDQIPEGGLTEFILWADAFKVKDDGTVDIKHFPDGDFNPGLFGCFSSIKASQPASTLALLDRLPRLVGVPFFVTRIRNIKVKSDRTDLVSVDLEGVLINPDEVAAGQDPADAGTLLGVVVRALSRGNIVGIRFTNGFAGKTWSITDSTVDWTLSVNRQVPDPDALNGFPGSIARIVGSTLQLEADGRLSLQVNLEQSLALVFGRLWPFESGTLQMFADSRFEFDKKSKLWRQTSFEFRTDESASEKLVTEQRWTSDQASLIPVKPKTYSWAIGQYLLFHREEKNKLNEDVYTFYVADRTTGCASPASGKLLEQLTKEIAPLPDIPVAEILETVEKFDPEDDDAQTVLTLATPTDKPGVIDIIRVPGTELGNGDQAIKRTATWKLQSAAKRSLVKLFRTTSSLTSIGVVATIDDSPWNKRLQFGPLPNDGESTIPGSTVPQAFPLVHLELGECQDRTLAVSTDHNSIYVWDVSTATENVTPSQTIITTSGSIRALAVQSHEQGLLIAFVNDSALEVYLLTASETILSHVSVRLGTVTGDISLTFALANPSQSKLFAGDPFLAIGRTESGDKSLETYRIPLIGTSFGIPVPIWTRTSQAEPIVSLHGGLSNGVPYFLVGRQDHVEVWSPTEMLRISSTGESPQAALPIDFKVASNQDFQIKELKGTLTPSRRVYFDLTTGIGKTRTFTRLQQGDYECLTFDPTLPDASRGKGTLVLWPAGDLTDNPDEFDPTVGPLRLVATLNKIEQKSASVRITIGTTSITSNAQTTLSTLLSVHRRDKNLAGRDIESRIAFLGTLFVVSTNLANGTLKLLLEGEFQQDIGDVELSGLLILENASGDPGLQTVVRCLLTTASDGSLSLKLINDVYWSTSIDMQSSGNELNILLSGSSTGFRVDAFAPKAVQPAQANQFLRLILASNRLQLQKVSQNLIPLIPELEPSRLQAPEKLGEKTVRLSHRRRGGLVLRPNIPSTRWGVVSGNASGNAFDPDPPSNLLLEPVVAVGGEIGPLMRLRQDGWLVSVPVDSNTPQYRTDGLFVLNADSIQAGVEAVSGLEARTQEIETTVDPAQERNRYRTILSESGAQGVAIHYSLDSRVAGRPSDLGFVDSPFYDHPGAAEDTNPFASLLRPSLRLSSTPAAFALAAMELVSMENALAPAVWQFAVDPRLLSPHEIEVEDTKDNSGLGYRYVLGDLPADPNRDVCCLAHRHYRMLRIYPNTIGNDTFIDQTPILHVAEVPAFRQPARLAFPIRRRWLFSETALEKCFFPRRLDWELAADKPGAMFQILSQARVTNQNGRSVHEPQVDFAIREPQFIRLKDCITAAVQLQVETKLEPSDSRINATLVWTEIIGSVEVADLAEKDWLQWKSSSLTLAKAPLQLIIDFNSEVFAVQQADAAVPAYRIEAQKGPNDTGEPLVKTKPAATYLVAKKKFEDVVAPQELKEAERDFTVTKDGDLWTARPGQTNPPIVSGTRYALYQDTLPTLKTSHRLVKTGGDKLVLMQDSVNGDPENQPINTTFKVKVIYDVGGNSQEEIEGTILCHRPLCLNLEGPNLANVNGRPIISLKNKENDEDIKVRSIADGSFLPQANRPLYLGSVKLGGQEVLILSPSVLADAALLNKGTVVNTKVVPYFEASVRKKTILKVEEDDVWTSALSLEVDFVENLIKATASDLVRAGDAKLPQAIGVFQLIKFSGKYLLARPSVGNGREAFTGKVTNFFDPSPITKPISKVTGSSPITIQVDIVWPDGTPIAVSEIKDVPEANGTWVIRKIKIEQSTITYGLYEPSVAGAPLPSQIKDIVVSVVTPLEKAFAKINERLARQGNDPTWDSKDRPMLQVYWSGSADYSNDDGTGVAWRPGGVITPLYDQAKQIKFLANSQLSPKLAFVLAKKDGAGLQRTILFGDSPPPFVATPRLEENGGKTSFVLEIRDNRESLFVEIPQSTSGSYIIFLVKSLPSGALVYDRVLKTIP